MHHCGYCNTVTTVAATYLKDYIICHKIKNNIREFIFYIQ